jgi:hypothetical protein
MAPPAFKCAHCNISLSFSGRRVPLGLVLSFIVSLLISQFIGLKVYAAVLWIPIFLLSLRFVLPLIVSTELKIHSDCPPKPPDVIRRNLVLFLAFWAGTTFTAMVYGYIMGWGAFLLGSKYGLWEITDMWSVPLGLVNPAFHIKADKSFVAVLGIVVANCYFYALGLTLAFKFVHGRLQRNRVMQLGISGAPVGQDDDEQ